ncbi:acyl-CoA binding protein, putative [Cryptosporidium muris RN66]|uniref:Acyl-CoA binding protein, putative n=1 Tax=Cryptosporidium muris (strain RN66) TaxID=441375 RepID=B6AGS3_CRYMR|nr:acyl-CoA binding protein, putative [Cryptosporidium muris RN66]EEA07414.1 acyl-CoA binding protein, putative [Cryptosporidium muris RN66]|eukprot:XP_002141763.1 acyl-CoA binding protein [Cryptosporidium muris RN66]
MTDMLNKNGRFALAAEYCANHVADFTNDELLELYGFYKQATVGDCITTSTSLLSVFSMKDKAKSKAWSALRGMKPEHAADKYIELICKKNPKWEEPSYNGKIHEILFVKGVSTPIKDSVLYESEERFNKQSIYILNNLIDSDIDINSPLVSAAFFTQVTNNNIKLISKVLRYFPTLSSLICLDGTPVIHYACDRGCVEICEILLYYGADPNAQDSFGDTPVHISCIAEQLECIRILKKYGADLTIKNYDGETPADVAPIEEILSLVSLI